MFVSMTRGVCLLLSGLLFLACGSEDDGAGAGSSSGGGSSSSSGSSSGESGVGTTGECSFTVKAASGTRAWQGTARAKMNGSGNLVVHCIADPELLELNIGNGSFDGPRTYTYDDFRDTADGSIVLRKNDRLVADTSGSGVSCTLDLAEGTPNRASLVPVGQRVAGRFRCAKLVAVRPEDGDEDLVLEDGVFAALVE